MSDDEAQDIGERRDRRRDANEPAGGINLGRRALDGEGADADHNLAYFLRLMGAAQSRVPLHEALNILRKYDGKTDVEEYLTRLHRDLRYLNYDFEWLIDNFDRLLTGDAKSWWSSRSLYYNHALESVRGEKADVDNLWKEMATEMSKFFDKKSQRVANRVKNRQTIYMKGQDPQEYVTKKLAVLRLIDVGMNDDVKVEQLIKGLPYDLREKMSVLDISTPEDVLKLLRRFNECYLDENLKSRTDTFQTEGGASSAYSTVRTHTAAMPQIATLNSDHLRRDPSRNYSRRDPNTGRPICHYCNIVGHVRKYCPLLNQGRNESHDFNLVGSRQPNAYQQQSGMPIRNFYSREQSQNPNSAPAQQSSNFVNSQNNPSPSILNPQVPVPSFIADQQQAVNYNRSGN